MKIGDIVLVTGWGYTNRKYNEELGRIYDIENEGANRPITVEFADGKIDCFTEKQITLN